MKGIKRETNKEKGQSYSRTNNTFVVTWRPWLTNQHNSDQNSIIHTRIRMTTTEKLKVGQAVQKLSDANVIQSSRLAELENKMTEIDVNITKRNKDEADNMSNETIMSKLEQNQQHWNELTSDVRNLRAEIQKIAEAIIMNQNTKHDSNQSIGDKAYTPQSNRNASESDESFESRKPKEQSTTHTIVIPPTSSIPTFCGTTSENPHQFLIRVKEYTETVNNWNEKSLLNGISQFLRDTALEWYCQLRTTMRRPQTWTEFATVFLNQFNSPIRRARQEQLWKNCKQEEHETINEFVVRLRALWREQKPNETEDNLIRHLMCKMKNNLLTMIGVSRCDTLDEIVFGAQKVEEILYQRSRQQQQQYNNTKQELPHHNSMATSAHDEDGQYEVQAVSVQQTRQYRNSYMKKPQYTNYSTRTTSYQREPQPTSNVKCYTCGLKGHIASHCRSRYNTHQQQYARWYPKNGNGARAGRDHDALM
jgi:hypothetical protein